MRSKDRPASEKLGYLKNQTRRVDGPDKSSTEFPDISTFASMSYAEYFDEMRENPLIVVDECQKAFFQFQTGIRRQLYELVALIYGFAQILYADEATRTSFLQRPFWEDRTYKKKDYLRMAFQFCFKAAQGEPSYHRACTYARALEGFFKESIPMEDIPALIENAGGIEKLARLNKKRSDGENTTTSPEEEVADDPFIDGDDEEGAKRQRPADDFLGDLDDDTSPSSRKRPLALQPPNWDPSRDLVVSMEPTELEEAMSCRRGRKLRLDLIVADKVGEWPTFKVQKMHWRN